MCEWFIVSSKMFFAIPVPLHISIHNGVDVGAIVVKSSAPCDRTTPWVMTYRPERGLNIPQKMSLGFISLLPPDIIDGVQSL